MRRGENRRCGRRVDSITRCGSPGRFAAATACALLFILSVINANAQLPTDVRQGHWAAQAVAQILNNHVMSLQSDRQFHGEAHVTKIEALNAVVALAKQLEAGKWKSQATAPMSQRVAKTMKQGAWEGKTVTRFELASVLARFGNYFSKAITKPKPGAVDLGKSEIVPQMVKIPVATSSPSYSALKYLVDNHMISESSSLLHPDSSFVKAADVSRSIAEMAAGLSNKWTELGHDADGSTPDATFHTRPPTPKP